MLHYYSTCKIIATKVFNVDIQSYCRLALNFTKFIKKQQKKKKKN